MNNNILVSVVIPTYAKNDRLENAINSILNQTHQNFEIIVVDDNTSDSEYRKSAEAIMSKYKEDSRIHYIQNEENMGGSGARNVGIENSKGDYIAFLDADDEYLPKKIERQLDLFLKSNNDKLALVYCDVMHVGKTDNVQCTIKKRMKGNCIFEAIMTDCIAATSQWLVKKSLLNDVGNFTIIPCKQDSTVILKLLLKGYEVDYVPEVLSKYYNVAEASRISFSKRRSEGEFMYYTACRQAMDRLSEKERKQVDYFLNMKMYILFSRKNSYSEKDRQEAYRKIVKARPIYTRYYFIKEKLLYKKRKLFRQI